MDLPHIKELMRNKPLMFLKKTFFFFLFYFLQMICLFYFCESLTYSTFLGSADGYLQWNSVLLENADP